MLVDMLSRWWPLACLLACACSAPAKAHDFWIEPGEYRMVPGRITPLTLQVGHATFRQRSPIARSRITRFEAITPTGTTIDLRADLHPARTSDDGELRFDAPGSHVVVLETDDRAQSHLPAIRFNDYLEVEGLTLALEQRERTRRSDRDGSEIYRRCAKALVYGGTNAVDSQTRIGMPVGLALEIVPERDPYAEPRPANLPVHVIYQGRRLAGALVKFTDLEHDAAPLEMQRTDGDGRALFSMPARGRWLLNVIWSEPLPESAEADFKTVFSSLSFGLP